VERGPYGTMPRGGAGDRHDASDGRRAPGVGGAAGDARLRERQGVAHHVLWPQGLAEKDKVVEAGLWHVCPAHVYEARVSAGGQVQVVVNFENCINARRAGGRATCGLGRDGRHRFVYAVHSPAVLRLLADQEAAGLARPAAARARDPWGPEVGRCAPACSRGRQKP